MAEETKTTPKKLERIYTVPFGRVYNYIHTRRTRRAMVMLRTFLARHFKVKADVIRISAGVNDAMWRDGIQKPPRSLKLRGVLENGKLHAWMIGEEEAVKKLADEKKTAEEKRKKESEKKKEASKPAEKKEAKADDKKTDATSAAKPAEKKVEANTAETKAAEASKIAEPRAGDVKTPPKSSGGASGGRKQI